jgi:hypothetical protein
MYIWKREEKHQYIILQEYGTLIKITDIATLMQQKILLLIFIFIIIMHRDRLCGQRSWLQTQRTRVWFPALPDFLRSSGSGTGSTQPREDNWGATWMEK